MNEFNKTEANISNDQDNFTDQRLKKSERKLRESITSKGAFTPSEIISHAISQNWTVEEGGSHKILVSADKKQRIPVPHKGGRMVTLERKTAKNILKALFPHFFGKDDE